MLSRITKPELRDGLVTHSGGVYGPLDFLSQSWRYNQKVWK
jgi:hypothetical protein